MEKSPTIDDEDQSSSGKDVLKKRVLDLCWTKGWTYNESTQNNLVEFCWMRLDKKDEKKLSKCTQSFLCHSYKRFKKIFPCEDWNNDDAPTLTNDKRVLWSIELALLYKNQKKPSWQDVQSVALGGGLKSICDNSSNKASAEYYFEHRDLVFRHLNMLQQDWLPDISMTANIIDKWRAEVFDAYREKVSYFARGSTIIPKPSLGFIHQILQDMETESKFLTKNRGGFIRRMKCDGNCLVGPKTNSYEQPTFPIDSSSSYFHDSLKKKTAIVDGEIPNEPVLTSTGHETHFLSNIYSRNHQQQQQHAAAATAASSIVSVMTNTNKKRMRSSVISCVEECVNERRRGISISTYDANDPNEDSHAFQVGVPLSKNVSGHFFAVIDGHGGSTCAEYVRQELIKSAIDKMTAHATAIDTYLFDETCFEGYDNSRNGGHCLEFHDNNLIATLLKETFQELDDAWFEKIGPNDGSIDGNKQMYLEKNGKWSVGCCVLLAVILEPATNNYFAQNKKNKKSSSSTACCNNNDDNNNNSRLLVTAHCGDVRASLLRRNNTKVRLTTDHTAENKKEVSYVRNLCSRDRFPIRKGRDGTDDTTLKVAGCLVPTRAIGDAFLKRSEFSFDPFARKCPYISCLPEVSIRKIDPISDLFLIIASDGIWDNVSEEMIDNWISKMNNNNNNNIPEREGATDHNILSPATKIITETMNVVCEIQGKTSRMVQALSKGRQRRNVHDDMTVAVVDLQVF